MKENKTLFYFSLIYVILVIAMAVKIKTGVKLLCL